MMTKLSFRSSSLVSPWTSLMNIGLTLSGPASEIWNWRREIRSAGKIHYRWEKTIMKLKKGEYKVEKAKYEIQEKNNMKLGKEKWNSKRKVMKLKKRNRVRGENPLLVRKNYYPRKASPPSVMAKRSCGVMITNIQHRRFCQKGGFGGLKDISDSDDAEKDKCQHWIGSIKGIR